MRESRIGASFTRTPLVAGLLLGAVPCAAQEGDSWQAANDPLFAKMKELAEFKRLVM